MKRKINIYFPSFLASMYPDKLELLVLCLIAPEA